MLYLASYFKAHPQRYTMLFIGFSGEEAGLLGSQYFTEHPLVPLDHIRFLTNLDIMGDATDGITVVNATEYPKAFGLLEQINSAKNYLPVIKSRGKAAISDHYFFTQAGVPSFFMYSNGGPGYYHDVFDKPNDITLKNIDGVVNLLIDFTVQLNKAR
jgi:aminopeptidase YwaD